MFYYVWEKYANTIQIIIGGIVNPSKILTLDEPTNAFGW